MNLYITWRIFLNNERRKWLGPSCLETRDDICVCKYVCTVHACALVCVCLQPWYAFRKREHSNGVNNGHHQRHEILLVS